jgi:hypothetical protein
VLQAYAATPVQQEIAQTNAQITTNISTSLNPNLGATAPNLGATISTTTTGGTLDTAATNNDKKLYCN